MIGSAWKRIVWAIALVITGTFGFVSESIAAPLAQVGKDIADTPLGQNTLALWLAVLAIITTAIVSLINQLPPNFTTLHKRMIAAGISALLALGDAFYRDTLDVANIGVTWLVVFLAASGFYVVITKSIRDSVVPS
jgi:hypothetical protein